MWCMLITPIRAATPASDAADSTTAMPITTNTSYQRRVEKSQRRWMSLTPNLGIMQYAGDIGMVSAGIGWDYGRHDRWETHFLIGYLPKFHSDNYDLTFTLKEYLVPWNVAAGQNLSFQPACFTLFVNTIFDDEFWTEEPDRYPQGYYGFSTRMRFSIGLGQRLTLNIPEQKRRYSKQLSLYYELSACDLYIVSAVPNKSITLRDILRLGIGMQYKFF